MSDGAWLEVVLAVAYVGGIAAVFGERIYRKKGLGRRTVQILSLLMIVPVSAILALRQVVSGEAVAAILGTILGYVLSGIGSESALDGDSK